jgi:hypothetical protein
MGCLHHLSGERPFVIAIVGSVAVLLSGALSGCSFVLDSSNKQCSVDSDCEHFGNHPSCQEGVCVESGLGPPGCFFGEPMAQSDFLNQCTTSTFLPYSNCDHIGLGCSNGPSTLPSPSPAMTGTAPAPTPPTAPTNLCTEGAPVSGNPPTPNMIWMFGSSDFGPLMRAAQPSLSAASPPYRAVFQNASSCGGVQAVFAQAADPTQIVMKDPTPAKGNWAFYFTDDGTQVNCLISTTGAGVPITIGISDLYSTTCGFTPAPSTVREFTGPIVPFVLATKPASSQNAISAEAAHLVFANGGVPPAGIGMKPATPWTDYTQYYIRNNTAGSTVLTALVIGVDKTMPFWGIDRASTDNLRDSLRQATDSEAALGIVSIDSYDPHRDDLKALYLQASGQTAGYLPDAKSTSFDKVNVRDGHYPLWGYVHFVVPTDPASNHTDISSAARAMTLLFSTDGLDPGLLNSIIKASEVPPCAMKVERSGEVGDFKMRTTTSCGCYFDFKSTGHASPSCQTCANNDDCPASHPKCNYGYCEVN